MKPSILILLLLASMDIAGAQEGKRAQDDYSLEQIQYLLQTAGGFQNGIVAKITPRLGDAAAIGIIKLLSPEQLRDPATIRRFIPILEDAFEFPEHIRKVDDHAPKVTLFLLSELKNECKDKDLTQRISQAIEKIERRARIHELQGRNQR